MPGAGRPGGGRGARRPRPDHEDVGGYGDGIDGHGAQCPCPAIGAAHLLSLNPPIGSERR